MTRVVSGAELRRNPFDEDWVMYAPGRAPIQSLTDGRRPTSCPFCPGAEETPQPYDVAILPNRFPSFDSEPAAVQSQPDVAEGYGHQDVFLFSDRHSARLADQDEERVGLLLEALGRRTLELFCDERIQAVAAFENSGVIFGPSIDHPHGQIFSLPFVPKRMPQLPSPCPLCRLAADEDEQLLTIERGAYAVLSVPRHARFPFEMHVLPARHCATLADLTVTERADVARRLLSGLHALERIGSGPQPYMLLFYQAPRPLLTEYHLRLEILPIIKPGDGRKYLGGLELGFGVYVNPAMPRESAAALREALELR